MPKVYIILLNYINWEDTVECLNSLNHLQYKNLEVVLADNFSGNNSLENIRNATSRTNLFFGIQYLQLDKNLGFGKGNNEALKIALERLDGNYFWILNNDTVTDPAALSSLVKEAEKDKAEGKRIGLYGSKLRYYSLPEKLQAVGGTYNKWLATLRETGNLETDTGQYDSYSGYNVLIGASLFVTHAFLNEVGLLGEDYFIYFEEIDWAERAKRKNWGIKVVTQSVIFHKQGISTKASGLNNNQKSKLSDFYYFRNRLIVTWRYFPLYLPFVYLSFIFTAFNRIKRRQWDRLPMLLNIMLNFNAVKYEKEPL